jgi:ABC-type dipeptide/oligopeptide/nickel transport system permease component
MLKVRNIVVLLAIIAVVYALAPAEKKRRWLDRIREFGRALTLSLVIYWVYMLVRYIYQHR